MNNILPYNFIYILAIIISALGLFIIITNTNYVKKIIGLGIFQSSVLIFYLSLGKVAEGITPILTANTQQIYTSPIPQVLMLTAIVVGFATFSVALALIYTIYKNFGTIYEHEIDELN